jgi:PhoH-like ATPase
MTQTIYVLDTNVLITDPTAFLAYGKGDTVVIPYKVIEELEKHKLDPNELGASVKECSRQLVSVIGDKREETLKNGIQLENGSVLKAIPCKELKGIEVVGPIKSGDDHILACAVGLRKENPDAIVRMVSNDMLLKVRANTFGIPVESHLHRSDVKSLDEIYTGYQKVTVDDETISKYWEENNHKEAFSISTDELGLADKVSPNEFIVLNPTTKRPWSMLRAHEGKRKLRFVHETKLDKIKPLNIEQAMAVDLLMDPKVQLVSLMGPAGTGKTLLALEAALNQVLSGKCYKTLLVLRPIHTVGKDIGYLPGDKKEKLEPWLAPIKDNLRFLMGDQGKKTKQGDHNLEYLFDQGKIEMEAMAYIRGRSINNAFILVDEAQNINKHELKTILTRVGKGTKVVLTGDVEQTDRNDVGTLTNGLAVSIERFRKYGIAGHVTLTEGVRSELSALAAKIL